MENPVEDHVVNNEENQVVNNIENQVDGDEDDPMLMYDKIVVAGYGHYWLSRCLYELSQEVGIPPPHFYGKKEFEEPNESEKWEITTLIHACEVDPLDEDLEYTQTYPDFECSVALAMQGAIARICNKYRPHIPQGSVFALFGERNEAGDVIPHFHQLPLIQHHLMEREFVAMNMEILMRRQISVIDAQRERIASLERTVLRLGDRKDELLDQAQDREYLLLATQAQSAHFATEFNQINKVKEERDKLQKTVVELQKKLAQKKAPAKKEKFKEDSDSEKSTAGSRYHPQKRMKAPQYFKLFKPQA